MIPIIGHILELIGQWYWVPLILVYIAVILTILIENRNPSKTIAWVLVIVFVPILGMLLYYLFGQKFKKVKEFQRKNQRQHQRLLARWSALDPLVEENLLKISETYGGLSRVFAFLANQRISPPVLGNTVQLLTNGEEKFPALLESLRAARHHIHLEYYIFNEDQIGLEVLNLLVEKSKQGVQVRVIIDSFGSPKLARQVEKWREAGLQMVVFLPVQLSSLANSNYRNHRKLAIVDGEVAFVGGMNISDYYRNPQPHSSKGSAALSGSRPGKSAPVRGYWRDTSVRLQGPCVNVLQTYFWLDWHFADGAEYDMNEGYLHIRPIRPVQDGAIVSFACSDPGSPAPYCMETLLVAISEAQESIRLCTPYFIPSEELSTALQIAAASGIRVELMIPKYGDSYIVQHASTSFLKPLLARGVVVYLYEPGFIHAKTVCIDGKLAIIGTVNLDTRSFYINFETSAVMADPHLCAELDAQFDRDLVQSQRFTMADWYKRPAWKRALDSLCRLLAPLL